MTLINDTYYIILFFCEYYKHKICVHLKYTMDELQSRIIVQQQKSAEWYTKRHEMLSSSEVASVLGYNANETRAQILRRKQAEYTVPLGTNNSHNLSVGIQWGEKYENIARNIYEIIHATSMVQTAGLIQHKWHKWLCTSPDGIIVLDSGNRSQRKKTLKLLEIKCPFRRLISNSNDVNNIPFHYWIQVQCQMEICDIDSVDFMECKFNEIDEDEYNKSICEHKGAHPEFTDVYWELENYNIQTVQRDKKWFARHLKQLQTFWNELNEARQNYSINTSRKRKNTFNEPENDAREIWISPSTIKNYLPDDPVLDWLHLYATPLNNRSTAPIAIQSGRKRRKITRNNEEDEMAEENKELMSTIQSSENEYKHNINFHHFLQKKGIEFENSVIQDLRQKYKHLVCTISTNFHQINDEGKYRDTIAAMKKGVPFIYHGILYDAKKHYYGIPDLIVREDYLSAFGGVALKLVANHNKHLRRSRNTIYNYVIIDIKYTTLNLAANGKNLLNSAVIRSHKGQIYFYNMMLNTIRKTKNQVAYLLGRRWQYTEKNVFYSGLQYEKLGIVDFAKRDEEVRDKVSEAIEWIRKLHIEGSKWNVLADSPKNILQRYGVNVFPNMKNIYDAPWHGTKNILAKRHGELTSLWMIGIKNRALAFDKKICSWKDNRCTAKILGLKKKNAIILSSILKVNRIKNTVSNIKNICLPTKIKSNLHDWKSSGREIFLDFETINDIGGNTAMIFMVGIGLINKGKWEYHNICVNGLTSDNELILLHELHEMLKKYKNHRIFHWSNAEVTMYRKACTRCKIVPMNLKWCDLLELFHEEPIAIKGAFNFSLKTIVGALVEHGAIKLRWPDQITGGINAMVRAIESQDIVNKIGVPFIRVPAVCKIIEYNEIDCRAVYEVLGFLRKYKK